MVSNRNRSLISLLLLLPVLIPLLFMVMNDLSKWTIKQQRRERLNTGVSLIQLRVQEDQVQWMDKKEIFIHGRMFDIKKSALKDGWYTFTGHYDNKETKLLRKQQAAQQQKAGQQTLLQVFKSLHQLFHEPQEPDQPLAGPALSKKCLRKPALITTVLDVNTPPPQVNSSHTV